MVFKPNYNAQRAERNRAKQAKKDEKLRERARKALRGDDMTEIKASLEDLSPRRRRGRALRRGSTAGGVRCRLSAGSRRASSPST